MVFGRGSGGRSFATTTAQLRFFVGPIGSSQRFPLWNHTFLRSFARGTSITRFQRCHYNNMQQPPSTSLATSFVKRDFAEALQALGTLQSNAATMESWQQQRLQDKQVDLVQEMRNYLSSLDVDISGLSCIHVAGTKGKGSTCAFVESILRRGYGLRTGLYTSPNLVHVRERIRINGKPLDEATFLRHFWECWDGLKSAWGEKEPGMPAYFRFLTILGFKVMVAEKVDVVVLEVGIGGRADATNVVAKPVVCGISSLGYDHCNVLGNTLSDIAFEKSGIFKEGRPAYTSPQEEEAMIRLRQREKEKRVSFLREAPPFRSFFAHSNNSNNIRLGLEGEFQHINASLAVSLCNEYLSQLRHHHLNNENENEDVPFPSSEAAISAAHQGIEEEENESLPKEFLVGLEQCKWAGRAQSISLSSGLSLHLDGAHTAESMKVCKQWFIQKVKEATQEEPEEAGQKKKKKRVVQVLVFGCNRGRSPEKLLKPLVSNDEEKAIRFEHAIFTTFVTKEEENQEPKSEAERREALEWQHSAMQTWHQLTNASSSSSAANVCASIPELLRKLEAIRKDHEEGGQEEEVQVKVLITGSLYLVGAVLEVLLAQNKLDESILDL
ncbi:Folylpolyglutamate synthase [Balamuthia mandrillaris]